MKFPYGISDFNALIKEGYLYVDRTNYIPLLEEGNYLGEWLLSDESRR